MQIKVERLSLTLRNPFKIAYGTSLTRENVLVHLSDGTYTGTGEAAVVPYYGETPERVIAYFDDPALHEVLSDPPLWLEDTLAALPTTGSPAARTAIDIALHDLWGQQLGLPLYRLWGLNPARCPQSSFTVSMADEDDTYRVKLRQAQEFGIVKLKLGSGDLEADLHMVEMACNILNDRFFVDANGGWSAAEALRIIPQIAAKDPLFIEQPVAKEDLTGWRKLRQELPPNMPPLMADESIQGIESIQPLVGLVDGINIKLAKCGGLRAARQMITLARANHLRVMLGCMVESSVAITAAAHLTPLVDYADVDGILLISNDPYRGVQLNRGYLTLPDAPGLGLTRV